MKRKFNITLIPEHYHKRLLKAETEEEKQEIKKEMYIRKILYPSLLDWSRHEITGFRN